MTALTKDLTGADRGNGEKISVLSACSRFIGVSSCSIPDEPEIREYIPTRRDVMGDVEISQFSDEITAKCTPLL